MKTHTADSLNSHTAKNKSVLNKAFNTVAEAGKILGSTYAVVTDPFNSINASDHYSPVADSITLYTPVF